MVEALAAVAVTAAIVAAIATIAGQWMPLWGRGVAQLQRVDHLSVGVERIVADVAAAEYVSASRDVTEPLFEGQASSITFVRSALEPNSPSHLEIVRIAQTADDHGSAIVRTRAAFVPSRPGIVLADFKDPVVLVRAPLRLTFAYAGPEGRWTEAWVGNKRLPHAVGVTMHDNEGHVLAASTTVLLRVTAPAQDTSKTTTSTQTSLLPLTSVPPRASRRRAIERQQRQSAASSTIAAQQP